METNENSEEINKILNKEIEKLNNETIIENNLEENVKEDDIDIIKTDLNQKEPQNRKSNSHNMKRHNFCCNECKINDKSNNKTCVCIVPRFQRRITIQGNGCKTCGCQGCTKEDIEYFKNNNNNSNNRDRYKHRRKRSSYDSDMNDNYLKDLNNFESNYYYELIKRNYVNYPPIIGLGIPQRTKSYLIGKPQKR